jgi:hypothetical protein
VARRLGVKPCPSAFTENGADPENFDAVWDSSAVTSEWEGTAGHTIALCHCKSADVGQHRLQRTLRGETEVAKLVQRGELARAAGMNSSGLLRVRNKWVKPLKKVYLLRFPTDSLWPAHLIPPPSRGRASLRDLRSRSTSLCVGRLGQGIHLAGRAAARGENARGHTPTEQLDAAQSRGWDRRLPLG